MKRYLSESYLKSNPDWHASDSAWKASQIAALLERNRISPLTICEIGCGAGEILTNLCARLPDTVTFVGYDVSPTAYAIAREKANERIKFYCGDPFDGFFDVLMLIDVVEHVEDYFQFLRGLRNRSVFKVFHVPLELTWHRVLRGKPLMVTRERFGHLHYFNKDVFLAVLNETGYSVEDTLYTPLSASQVIRKGAVGTHLANVLRKVLFNRVPDLTARALGGYSLLVLAK
ncbi:MAG: methyltransferase domain-containing protein [Pseudomonadota bacterium]